MYTVKFFKPDVLSSNRVRGYMLSGMRYIEEQMLVDVEATTATWSHKPIFEHKLFYSGGNATISISTTDPAWNYLDGGTKVRYAQMARGFQSKTAVRWFGSGPGNYGAPPNVGGVRFVSQAIPHHGIAARQWSDMLAEKYDDILQKVLDDAIMRGLF